MASCLAESTRWGGKVGGSVLLYVRALHLPARVCVCELLVLQLFQDLMFHLHIAHCIHSHS